MAVLDRAHVDEDQVGRAARRRQRLVVDASGARLARLKLEQHLLLQRLGEVELLGVERLHHLPHAQRA